MNRIDVEVSGGCQCGAVRYRATQMLDNTHICHCRMCQKAVGNIFVLVVEVPDDALIWTRGRPAVWRSSGNVERGFCSNCGTPLFYRDVTDDRIGLNIGALDRPRDFPPRRQVGTESRMPWFDSLSGLEDGGPTGVNAPEWAAAIIATNNQHPDRDTDRWPPERHVANGP